MIRLMRQTKRGPNITLGDNIYHTSSSRHSGSRLATEATMRLAEEYNAGTPWPIDLVIDKDGAERLIKVMAGLLMAFPNEDRAVVEDHATSRERVKQESAAWLREIADRVEA